MSASSDSMLLRRKAAQTVAARLADRSTPLIRNAWYVAALGEEITRTPIERRLLGRSVVMFRTEDGRAILLQNRCAHRSFPLSEGKLEGDTLVCRYHGLRYDCEGRCIEVPSQQSTPRDIAVRRYAVIEHGPAVWFWAGDAEAADASRLPAPDWLASDEWDRYTGYLRIGASYVHMHENLLDLSHLSFLHETTFGTPEYARAPIDTTIAEPNFEVWRHVQCELPAIYAKPLGWEGQQALRSSGAQFVAPGLHVNTGIFKNLERPESEQQQPMVKVAQLLTPEDNDCTHYFYCAARNFIRHDSEVTEFMRKAQYAAFSEDVYALESIRRVRDEDDDPQFFEKSVAADRPGLAMRQYLKRLADLEAAARAT